jgi:caffeoyl-CoA O-methyltransferase
MHTVLFLQGFSLFFFLTVFPVFPQTPADNQALDKKVKQFLESHKKFWRDLNIPEADGKTMYDIIVKHGYKKALEIGTSTGHSGIWIAWALSKTGGRLTTFEIDESRHKTALENFKKAGLDKFIDARLADAHTSVPELKGPYDFVFSDADKEWYKNYLVMLLPKLSPGGCFAAHNVSSRNTPGIQEFLDYVESLPELTTTIDNTSGAGLSISFKKEKK